MEHLTGQGRGMGRDGVPSDGRGKLYDLRLHPERRSEFLGNEELDDTTSTPMKGADVEMQDSERAKMKTLAFPDGFTPEHIKNNSLTLLEAHVVIASLENESENSNETKNDNKRSKTSND